MTHGQANIQFAPENSPGFNVLDLEASGLSSADYPIEVGVALADGNLYQSLIAPQTDWEHWDPEAQSLHGIPKQATKDMGRPAHKVCEAVNRLCHGQKVYTDCWSRDSQWLATLFGAAKSTPKFELLPIETLIPEESMRDFWATKKRLANQMDMLEHRALPDAILIQATLNRLLG